MYECPVHVGGKKALHTCSSNLAKSPPCRVETRVLHCVVAQEAGQSSLVSIESRLMVYNSSKRARC